MFTRTFRGSLFGAERPFARGGVPAGVLLPKHARYSFRSQSEISAPHSEKRHLIIADCISFVKPLWRQTDKIIKGVPRVSCTGDTLM